MSRFQAMAVLDGKILELGTNDAIQTKYQSDSSIDASGEFLYPGFIDAHCHFVGYSGDLNKVSLVGTASFDEVLDRLKRYNAEMNPEWIYGRGWDQNDWKEKNFPDNVRLSELFPDKPVFIKRIDGHAALANRKALELAGISADTRLKTGYVEVKNGTMTGILLDDAMSLVEQVMPEISEDLLIRSIKKGQQNCFEVGLTTLSDAGLEKKQVLLLDSLHKVGLLKLRIYAMLNPTEENFDYFFSKGIYKTDYLNVRSFKIYADGALGSRGACLLQDYDDKPGDSGFLLNEVEYFKKIALRIKASNYQMCTHAIGDSANRIILKTYAEILGRSNERRWRIEHAQVVNKDDFHFFGEYSIIPSVQPTHATSDMYWAEQRIGKERLKGAYAYKDLLKQNGWIPLGTDFPVEGLNPLLTFFAAVARRDSDDFPTGGFQRENALTRRDALLGITLWAAKSNFEENEKGSLEPGKYADFVILPVNLLEDDLVKIRKAKVTATFVAGTKVYSTK